MNPLTEYMREEWFVIKEEENNETIDSERFFNRLSMIRRNSIAKMAPEEKRFT